MASAADSFYLPIQWRTGVTEDIQYATTVTESADGSEQRVSRGSKPRLSIEFDTVLTPTVLTEILPRLSEQQARRVYVSVFRHSSQLLNAAVSGGNTLTPVTQEYWMQPGEHLVIVNPATDEHEFAEIQSAAFSLTLTGVLSRDYPQRSKIYRMLPGWWEGNVPLALATDRKGSVRFGFQVDPIAYFPPGVGVEGPQYNGREIFPFPINWRDTVTLDFEQRFQEFNRDSGAISRWFEQPNTLRRTQFKVSNLSLNDSELLSQFFMRKRGQWKSFYLSDPAYAFFLAPGIVNTGQTTLRALGRQVFDAFNSSNLYQHIEIKLNNGTFIRSQVSSIFLDVSGDSLINLNTPIPVAFDPLDVIRTGWMTRSRFFTGTLRLEWFSDSVSEATLNFSALAGP